MNPFAFLKFCLFFLFLLYLTTQLSRLFVLVHSRVHISEQTKSYLNGVYELECGNGDQRDSYLRDHGIQTYLIVADKPKSYSQAVIIGDTTTATNRNKVRMKPSKIKKEISLLFFFFFFFFFLSFFLFTIFFLNKFFSLFIFLFTSHFCCCFVILEFVSGSS